MSAQMLAAAASKSAVNVSGISIFAFLTDGRSSTSLEGEESSPNFQAPSADQIRSKETKDNPR